MRGETQGFTIIEVVIGAVVLAIMMMAMMGSFNVGQDICSVGGAELTAQTSSTRALGEMTRMLRQSRIIGTGLPVALGVADDGSYVQFQIPVDHDSDGDILDGGDLVEYGAKDLNGNYLYQVPTADPWVMRYQFFEKKLPGGQDEHLIEAQQGRAGVDVNGDGDTNDTFAIGQIVEIALRSSEVNMGDNHVLNLIENSTGRVRTVMPAYVIVREQSVNSPTTAPTDYNEDVDRDTSHSDYVPLSDPVFAQLNEMGEIPLSTDPPGRNIRISFYVFRLANKERVILQHPTTIVETRNE